ERVPGAREARAVGVVLDDHLRIVKPPGVLSVVTLRVRGHLRLPPRPEWDRLPDDVRFQRREVDGRRGEPDAMGGGWASPGNDREDRDGGGHGPDHGAAARIRATVRSRPRSSRDSGKGGDTFDPVTAALIGCQPFVRFRPAPSASRSIAAAIASWFHPG